MNVNSPQNPAPLAPDSKGTPNPRPMGLLTLPGEVKERELEYVGHRRQATGYVPPPDAAEAGPSDLIGLSLSGGGIRSATFSLGVLQKLASAGVLPVADYLCTVSGGGYAGSCFSSLMTFSEDQPDAAGSRRGQETQSYSPSGNDPMWWKRRAAAGEFPGNTPLEGTNSDPTAPRMDMTDKNPLLWRETCQHLRKHGDFVIQRQGLFCRETLRAFGWFVIGLLCTFTSYVLLILLSGSLFSLLVTALAGTEFWSHDGTPRAVAHAAAEPGMPAAAAEESRATLSGALSGVAASFRGFVGKCGWPWDWHVVPVGLALVLASALSMYDWRAIREAVTDPRNGSASESGANLTERGTLLRIATRHLAVLTAIVLLTGLFGLCVYRPGGFFSLWTPLSYGLGVTLMGFAMGTLYLPYSKRWTRSYRSPVGSLLGMGGIGVAAGLLLIVLAWGIRDLVSVQSAVWSLLSLAATLGVSRLLMSLVDGNVERMTTWKKYSPAVLNSILAVLVVLFVLLSFLLAGRLMVWLASWAAEHRAEIVSTAGRLSSWLPGFAWPRESGEAWAWFVACQTLAALLLAASFCGWGRWIDFNRIGPHYFYRDRLTEAYLQTEASITVRHPQTGNRCTRMELVRNDASLLVKNLLDWPGRGNPAPYHLIECAVNLAGSRDLARRSRKSDHFIFSRRYVGSTSTGYVSTEEFRKGETSLAAAMTISGAAVSSGMGFYTSFAQSFFTTLFNLRLGNWVVNPRVYGSAVYPPYEPRLPSLLAASSRDRRFAGDVLKHNENQVFWPWYLAKEMFGATTSESPLVYLSDGGHTGDNLGLYPLLQRRCKLIIVVDAEADPYYDFGSLATAITQINADENVGVQIDLEQLRPRDRQEGGLAKTHFLLGRIRYPQYDGPAGQKASQLEHGGGDGWLIYLKSSMKEGRMPAPIISYAAFNPKFPHQSTLDQFFDDDQFEAYRSLGSHIAEEMLEAFCAWWEQQIPKGSAPAASTEVARGEHDQQPHSPDLIDTRLASLSGGQIAEVARRLIDWAANSPSQPFPATTRQPAPPKRPPPPPNPTRDEVLQALQQAQLKTGAAKSLRTSPQRLRKLCEQYGIGEKDWKNVRPPDETETSPNAEASPV